MDASGYWVDGMAKKAGFVDGDRHYANENALQDILQGLGYPEESVLLLS